MTTPRTALPVDDAAEDERRFTHWVRTTEEVSTSVLEKFAGAIHTVIGQQVVDPTYTLRRAATALVAAQELAIARALQRDHTAGQSFAALHTLALERVLQAAQYRTPDGDRPGSVVDAAETAAWARVEMFLRGFTTTRR